MKNLTSNFIFQPLTSYQDQFFIHINSISAIFTAETEANPTENKNELDQDHRFSNFLLKHFPKHLLVTNYFFGHTNNNNYLTFHVKSIPNFVLHFVIRIVNNL